MFNPKVSIIIPVYNCEKYIEQCIDSVFNQTYKNIEVFCIDNESKDNSYSLIKEIKEKKYPQMVIGTAPNIYPHCCEEPRDVAFGLMTGEYFMLMGADDYLHETFIEKNIEIFSKAPNKILALQSGIMGIKDGVQLGITSYSYKNIEEMKALLLQKCVVNTPTVVFSKKLIDNNLFITHPEIYSGAGDYDMYCFLADNGIMVYPVPQWLGYYYRWHAEQATWSMAKSNVRYDLKVQEFWKKKWSKE